MLLATTLLAGGIVIVSCNQEDDDWDEMDVSLDVTSRTPMTKSNAMEPGASQTLGSSVSRFDIPVEEDECMMYAIIRIAINKGKPITYVDNNGIERTRMIGDSGFTASDAYATVKGMATSQSWTPCDVYGNAIPNAAPYNYSGGAMAPSVASVIGKQSGILEGKIMYFDSYEEMQSYISSYSFKKDHPDGTYIISSESQNHATVGRGVDKKGNVHYQDATSNSKYKEKEQTGSWTVIF